MNTYTYMYIYILCLRKSHINVYVFRRLTQNLIRVKGIAMLKQH